ncbi:MAG: MFS transporter, partial [Thermoleophilia bacterium]
ALAAGALAAAPSALWFAAALVALGAACSVHHTAALTIMTRAGRSDPRLFGQWGMMGNLGLAVAPAFGGLLAAWANWRLPFACGAALGLACAAWLWLGTRHLDDRATVAELTAHEPHRTHLPSFALVLVISAALGFVFTGFAAFLPAMSGTRVGFLPAAAVVRGGLVASLVFAIGAGGSWWGGHAGRRAGLEHRYAAIIALNAACLALAAVFQDWALVVVLVAFSFVHFSTQPLENVLIARYTSHEARGMSFAVSCVTAFGVGALGSYAGGLVADAAGGRLQYVYFMLAGVAALAAACAAGLAVLARRREVGAPGGGSPPGSAVRAAG